VTLKIYDNIGREISNLVSEKLGMGTYEVSWDGSSYPSGVYFYTLETKNLSTGKVFKEAKKMLIVK
jgi:hypothetical protein